MKRFFRVFVWILFCVPALLSGGCGVGKLHETTGADTAMGTVVRLTVFTREDGAQKEEILKRIGELEKETLSWRLETAEVCRVNRTAGSGERVEVSDELAGMLEQCARLTEDSGGAFDAALGTLTRLWDIDGWAGGQRTGTFQAPGDQSREEAMSRCGFARIHFQPARGEEPASVCPEEGAMLDLGAVGKGIALDRILEYLQAEETVTGAVVSVGGSVLTYGEKPDGALWKVGIADPLEPNEMLGVLTLTGQTFLSTSGDYERYVEADGVRYHHILDPATGFPADSGLRSVTVLADSGLLSDGLSTACFVLGREKGMELAKRYGAEALFVERDGAIFMTPGMEALFRKTQ